MTSLEGPPTCPVCGQDWGIGPPGRVRLGWQPCGCVAKGGHHYHHCLRCGHEHFDPPCANPGEDVSGLGARR